MMAGNVARNLLWVVFCCLTLVASVAGCGAKASGSVPAYAEAPMGPMDAVATADDAEMEPESEPPPAPAPMEERVSSASAGAPPPRQAATPVPVTKRTPAKLKDEPGPGEQPSEQAPVASGARAAVASQMLVYTAELRIRVREVAKAIDAVEKLAKARGGYLVVREDNRITVRVPSAKFDPVLEELGQLGDLVHRNVSVEDVTDLYFDLQTRMKNLEVVKQRLEELLAKAKTVEESLAVQRQLERVTVELERLRGKLKLIGELVMFSTITVVFEPKSTEHLDSNVRLPFPWMNRLGLGELLRL